MWQYISSFTGLKMPRKYHDKFYRETVGRRCSTKRIFLKISQNLQGKNCIRAYFLRKLLASLKNFARFPWKQPCRSLFFNKETLFKKKVWHRCSPVNVKKLLWTPFLKNTSGGCFLLWGIARWWGVSNLT